MPAFLELNPLLAKLGLFSLLMVLIFPQQELAAGSCVARALCCILGHFFYLLRSGVLLYGRVAGFYVLGRNIRSLGCLVACPLPLLEQLLRALL